MLYFCNLYNVATTCAFDIHINTTIEVVDGPPCISMSKLLCCYRCSNSNEKMFMIEFLGVLKFFGTFHLSPIGELVGYNKKFQPQEVVVEVVREVVGDSFCV
jgi:hypothetical protein